MRHLTPAEYAIRCFGSAYALAQAISCGRNAPLRWLAAGKKRTGKSGPRSRTAGDIPMAQVRQILAAAKERQLPITPNDLVYGKDVPEGEAVPVATAGEPVAAV